MMMHRRLAVLVLAAGYSSRAPGFKPLLPFGGKTIIETVINRIWRAGLSDIIVVIGHQATDLIPLLNQLQVKYVINEQYSQGMLSSIKAGIQSLQPNLDAFFIMPVDMPFIQSSTITLLAKAYEKRKAAVIYPVYQSKRGHPPLISTRLSASILSWQGAAGLNRLLREYEANSYDVMVQDEGILKDIDTAQDYNKSITRLQFLGGYDLDQ